MTELVDNHNNMQERGNKILKVIDATIGSIIVYLFGLLFKHKSIPLSLDSNYAYKFLLIRTSAIGDTILLSSIIEEIKAALHNAHITILCAKNNIQAAQILDNVNETIIFDFGSPISSLIKLTKLKEFDYIIDFAQWDKISAIISALIKSKYRVGFFRQNMRRHYVYDCYAIHSDDCHEIDNYRKLLQLIHIPLNNVNPSIKDPDVEISNKDLNDFISHPFVVFHLFPGGSLQYLKKWPINYWLELAKMINQQYKLPILLTGCKKDYEEAEFLIKELFNIGIDCRNAAGKMDLSQTAAILKKACFMVSVNTGIMHLAAAESVPIISINGATSIKRWGPLNHNSVAIASNLKCYPCISLGYESKCKEPVCLRSITPKLVFEKITELIN